MSVASHHVTGSKGTILINACEAALLNTMPYWSYQRERNWMASIQKSLPHSDKGLHQNPRFQNLTIGATFLCAILYDCSPASPSSIGQKRIPLRFRGQLELSLTITDITPRGDERHTPWTSFNMGGSSMTDAYNFLRRTL